jgi:hypothetical protein
MKKYLGLTLLAVTIISLCSFIPSNKNRNGEKNEITNSEVWEFMQDNVFDKLNKLVSYDKKKSFSRCPSGFSQRMNEEQKREHFVYGSITFAEGCQRKHYCYYGVNWNTKKTYLKKSRSDEYVTMNVFIKNEEADIAKF